MSLFRREKLTRLVAFTPGQRNACCRKHRRQRKSAVVTRHEIQTHFSHLLPQIRKDFSRRAIVLNECMALVLAIAPFVRTAVFEPEDTGDNVGGEIPAIAHEAQRAILQTLDHPFILRGFPAFSGFIKLMMF